MRRVADQPAAAFVALTVLLILETLALIVVGAGAALLVRRQREAAREAVRRLERIRVEAAAAPPTDEIGAASRRLDELRGALERAVAELGATRVVLWDVDERGGRAVPRLTTTGPLPRDVLLSGDALGWVWEEGAPLRLDAPPLWAAGPAGVAAVHPRAERAALITAEFHDSAELPSLGDLDQAAARVRAFVRMQAREAAAERGRARFQRVIGFLRWLPVGMDMGDVPADLARAAADLTGGTGGAVAWWDGERGRIAAIVGDDGVVAAEAPFGPADSELGVALRAGVPLERQRRPGARGQLPVLAPGERWIAEPRALAVLPLIDGVGRPAGVLAVWHSGTEELDPEALELLEALGPLLALQLAQTGDILRLREQAHVDALTGLPNRAGFDEKFEDASKRFHRYRRSLSLILLDLDHFKSINDRFGHAAGDAVLRTVAEVVRHGVRDVDVAARWGGEELVVLLPETMRTAALDVAERLREAIERSPVRWQGGELRVTASLGVSTCPECVDDPGALIRSADAMLYRAKEAGRNRVELAPVG